MGEELLVYCLQEPTVWVLPEDFPEVGGREILPTFLAGHPAIDVVEGERLLAVLEVVPARKSRPTPKSRFLSGEGNGRARLNQDWVLSARAEFTAGLTTAEELAAAKGVGVATVKKALSGETWQHLPSFRLRQHSNWKRP